MDKIFRVKVENGYREFTDENEAKAFETNQKLKEEEKSKKELAKHARLEFIRKSAIELNKAIELYEKDYNQKVCYTYNTNGDFNVNSYDCEASYVPNFFKLFGV
jgi:hypothetical protein